MTLFRNKILLLYAFMAAVVYSSTAGFFIYYQSYVQSWLLYVGNILFGIAIAIFLYMYYKRSNYTLKISELVVAGQLMSITGILISCVLCTLLLLIFVPEVFIQAKTHKNVLENAPGQLQQGKNNYLVALLMDVVFGNVGTGAFIAILFPFTISRYQKGT